jgi:hypothetical protein
MSTRPMLSEIKTARSELVVLGFVEDSLHRGLGGQPIWRLTALGQQERRFMEVPHEEPSFLAAWIASFERRYPGINQGFAEEAFRKDLEDVERADDRRQICRRAWAVYLVAKTGDVDAFWRALASEEQMAKLEFKAAGARFVEAPHDEPSFLAALIAFFERLYGDVMPRLDDEDLVQDMEAQMVREGVDHVADRMQTFIEMRELYRLAKAGDVGAFHRAFVRFTEADDD